MVKRGPKTQAEYRAEGVLIPGVREPPPDDLEPGAAALWNGIVQRLPDDWFTTENRPLLKAYCRHSDYADGFAKEIVATRATIEALEKSTLKASLRKLPKLRDHLFDLHKMHAHETQHAASCGTKLRLTNQSRYVKDTAASKARSGPSHRMQPWHSWGTSPVNSDKLVTEN